VDSLRTFIAPWKHGYSPLCIASQYFCFSIGLFLSVDPMTIDCVAVELHVAANKPDLSKLPLRKYYTCLV